MRSAEHAADKMLSQVGRSLPNRTYGGSLDCECVRKPISAMLDGDETVKQDRSEGYGSQRKRRPDPALLKKKQTGSGNDEEAFVTHRYHCRTEQKRRPGESLQRLRKSIGCEIQKREHQENVQ